MILISLLFILLYISIIRKNVYEIIIYPIYYEVINVIIIMIDIIYYYVHNIMIIYMIISIIIIIAFPTS